jgi:predicted DNA-binding transcriptional regulator YafY
MTFDLIFDIFKCLSAESNGLTVKEISNRTGKPEAEVKGLLELFIEQDREFFLLTDTDNDDEESSQGITRYWLAPYGERLPQLNLTLEEIKAMLEVITSKSSRKEILSLLEKLNLKDAQPSPFRFYQGIAPPIEDLNVKKNRIEIEKALMRENAISITYKKEEGLKIIRVYPLGLVNHVNTGLYYLLGSPKKVRSNKPVNPQFFRLDRIESIESGEEFIYPSHFSLEEYMKPRWGVQAGEAVEVEVCFYNEAQVVSKAERVLGNRYPREALSKDREGNLLFKGLVIGKDEFLSWLRKFGSSVEVIKPQALRDRMIRTASRWSEIYSEQ